MSETRTSFVLELIDRITAPARKMTEATKGLAVAEKAVEQASAATAAAITAVGAAAESAARKVDKLTASARRHGPLYNPLLAGMGPYQGPHFNRALAGSSQGFIGPVFDKAFAGQSHGFIGPHFDRSMAGFAGGFIGPRRATRWERTTSDIKGFGKDLWAAHEAASATNDKVTGFLGKLSAGPIGMATRGIGFLVGKVWDLGEALVGAALSAAKLTLALGVIAAGLFVKRVIELADFAQKSREALTKLAGSTEAGNKQFAQARRIAWELGQNVEDVTNRFISLRAAQFSAGESETIHKLSADLAALTGSADAANRAVLAITQIKAKGRLQSEELLQLSEGAKLSQSMVFEELMKSTGLSREQLMKEMQKGKIDAVRGIAAIQAAIMRALHEKRPGEYARSVGDKSLGGVWERLKSMPDMFMLDIADAINTDTLIAGMRTIIDAFEAGSRTKLTDFAQRAVDLLGKLLPLTVDFAEGFMAGFDAILGGMDKIDPSKWKDKARAAGEYLARFFGVALKFATDAIPVLTEAVEKFVKSVDWNKLTEGLKAIDWGKLAADFVILAGALASIASKLAAVTGGTVSAVQHANRTNAEAAKGGGSLGDSVKANMALMGGTGVLAGGAIGSFVPGVGTVIGAAGGGVVGGALGIAAGIWDYLLDASLKATAPGGDGPTASVRPGINATQNIANVNIQAPPDPKLTELAKLARDEVVKGLTGLADRELGEAVPA